MIESGVALMSTSAVYNKSINNRSHNFMVFVVKIYISLDRPQEVSYLHDKQT